MSGPYLKWAPVNIKVEFGLLSTCNLALKLVDVKCKKALFCLGEIGSADPTDKREDLHE